MISPHFFYHTYIFPFFFQQNDCTPPKCVAHTVANCHITLTVFTLRWRIFLQYVWMSQMSMTDAGTTQDSFILPAQPVRGLPISQDQLDRMKLVRDRTIPIILPSGKNILVNMVFKIKINAHLATQYAFSVPLMPGYQTKNNVFIGKFY